MEIILIGIIKGICSALFLAVIGLDGFSPEWWIALISLLIMVII